MKKKVLKRFVSALLSLVLCISLIPSAFAEGTTEVFTYGGNMTFTLYDVLDTRKVILTVSEYDSEIRDYVTKSKYVTLYQIPATGARVHLTVEDGGGYPGNSTVYKLQDGVYVETLGDGQIAYASADSPWDSTLNLAKYGLAETDIFDLLIFDEHDNGGIIYLTYGNLDEIVAAAGEDPWGMDLIKEFPARLYNESIDVVQTKGISAKMDGTDYYDYTTNSYEVWAYPEGTTITVENLDCKYGVYVYFHAYKPGEGTIPVWAGSSGVYSGFMLDLTGKYYGDSSVRYLTADPNRREDDIPAGDGLYWRYHSDVSGLQYDEVAEGISDAFFVQPGESVSFSLPDDSPDTMYQVCAATYHKDTGRTFWRYFSCVIDDGLYALSTPVEQENGTPFTDVPADAYYTEAVKWAYENGITTGTSETTFGPMETCTRGQVVTFLWRAKGCPEPTSTVNPFTDVTETDYFYKAVLWAVENGITNGMTETTFGPKETCTSGHVVTFLWRANGQPAAAGESTLVEGGQWYSDAVAWADSVGLLSGTGVAFEVKNNAPRADIVTYLYRDIAE